MALIVVLVIALVVVGPAAARGPRRPIHVGWVSQQYSPSRAGARARIDLTEISPGHPEEQSGPRPQLTTKAATGTSAGETTARTVQRPVYPSLPASSPLLKEMQPNGPGSFWYRDAAGHVCEYTPSTTGVCVTVTGGQTTQAATPAVAPVAIAEHAAQQLGLSAGRIETSPSGVGLTGTASWFWLDPAPASEQMSVSLAGEAVTVTAAPRVTWEFGDGTSLDAGPGVPYQPGPVPVTAVTHVYGTRCLAGDKGHDPYVLSGCGDDGYRLVASVSWELSYQAEGPVAASGTLASRTTTSSRAYQVGEARAFLVGGGGG